MTPDEQEMFDYVNKCIRAEHGKKLTLDQLYTDAELDSFGIFVSLNDIDDKYNIMPDTKPGVDPMTLIDWDKFTIKYLVTNKAVPCL